MNTSEGMPPGVSDGCIRGFLFALPISTVLWAGIFMVIARLT